jgi:N-methylhydantoinase A
MPAIRLAFDAGGTFTDVVYRGIDGTVTAKKVPSLLERVAQDVRDLVSEGAGGGEVSALLHATTLASNAVIQREVAKTALITTHGFRDVLDIKAQKRPNIFDPDWERLPPLIPRALTSGIKGRMLADGTLIEPIDEKEVEFVVKDFVAQGVQAVAVCLLNSYSNPEQERQVAEVLRRVAPDLAICCSFDIDPDANEYERASTTAVNASLMPVIGAYLDRLEAGLSPLGGRLMIMRSSGGLIDSIAARSVPAHMIESGSAAGALAAGRLAKERGLKRVLALDMGGTTAKACLIEDGICLERPWGEIGQGATVATRLFGGGGYAVRVPSLDIVEIGAGGGSIGWIDGSRALRVGPQSAGADPGPACYGRGGQEPTVTDACVLLGYTNPTALARGTLKVNPALAESAIREWVAEVIGIELLAASWGMFNVANATMMRALRAVSTERGYDPRACDLVAFGGAGPVHAAALADSLGIRRIFVPVLAGLFSALGLLLAEVRHDFLIGIGGRLEDVDTMRLQRAFAAAEADARVALAASCGGEPPGSRVDRFAAVRYAYQIGEIVVPLDDDLGGDHWAEAVRRRFVEGHIKEFGFSRPDAPIELQNLRLSIASTGTGAEFRSIVTSVPLACSTPQATRLAYFGPAIGSLEAPVLQRAQLIGAATGRTGPLLIQEDDTTIVVPPGWSASCNSEDWIVELERLG